MRLFAPAKLNLYLHVTGRRADGFHLLDSAVVFVNVGDELELEDANALTLEVTGSCAQKLTHEVPENNLVFKAARLLQAHYGVQRGAHMRLHKNLPVGSGIGGGSSDAAAALRGLVMLWDIDAGEGDLHDIARRLGSDVPACLRARTLRMEGVGDQITPLQDAQWPEHFLLVNPMLPVLTADVYRALAGRFTPSGIVNWDALDNSSLLLQLQRYRNDLAAPAQELCPAITQVLQVIEQQGGCLLARMSGSGATCFGIFETAAQAQQAERILRSQQPDWWVKYAQRISGT